jgi:serine/threonine protein kinase
MFGWLFGKKQDSSNQKAPKAPRVRRVNLAKLYTTVAETGQGSMSRVYRAVENRSGRVVCLKVQDAAKSAAANARTVGAGRLNEGEIGKRINHPNVVKTFDWGYTTKGEHFIVMEFIDGVSLTYVRQSRVLKLEEKLEFLAQAADGLAAVHAAGFIHRDFGPKNLLVNRDDQVKLIDFGLAVPNTAAFQRPGNRTGTLNYMAPELLRREATDERIDIFSFGVTAFEFLTGRLPYDTTLTDPMAVMRMRINTNPTRLEVAAPQLPAELCALVNKALARKPADRWPAMNTMGEALRELPVASADRS